MLTCTLLNEFVFVVVEVLYEETEILCRKPTFIEISRYEACIAHKCSSMLMKL